MDKKRLEYLQRIEERAAETGWVSPLTQEDRDYVSGVYASGTISAFQSNSA